jgi:hypothetical protein
LCSCKFFFFVELWYHPPSTSIPNTLNSLSAWMIIWKGFKNLIIW